MLQIESDKRLFTKNNQPIFYLADTCWSAFTNITENDWNYYLDYRKSQDFNVLQINMLQQWDASQTELGIKPFAIKDDGTFDFYHYNEDYFNRAYRMIKQAYNKGLTVALVLLWANYIPDTWASQMPIKQLGTFPKELVLPYVDKVMRLYDEFHPIYVISGDTDFPNETVVTDYYLRALNRVKENNPNALTTFHIRGRESDLPKVLKESSHLDFYMFQSGHNSEFQEMTYQLAETFYEMEPRRPLLNSEPCYEMMGYSRRVYGRFSREDVRKAAWQSVLSGASSGVTYGAHGIWSWHESCLEFDSNIGEAFETPYDWRDALHFKGAWDYAFLKTFIESHQLFDLVPKQDILVNHSPEIRVAENDSYLLIYVPSNIRLKLYGDWSCSEIKYLDLEDKLEEAVTAVYSSETGQTMVNMHRFTKDALLIINKEK
ncbi:apiosidase-like domain-containing protein [Streptococcus sp. S784/96/1]|uniref:apiosidase-like domain-containing protein n=1 Tax=Streptococcus sp. S784/96/1 TaxID=2653499 RepID=UPI0013866918|nr:DUF4038 domain-containing protein [Streptococcus sp. S784/96/1]